MFEEKEKDGLIYITNSNTYSILEGKTSNNLSSDILFIFKEPTDEDIQNGNTGVVIGFCYGGFDNIDYDFIENMIIKYEEGK